MYGPNGIPTNTHAYKVLNAKSSVKSVLGGPDPSLDRAGRGKLTQIKTQHNSVRVVECTGKGISERWAAFVKNYCSEEPPVHYPDSYKIRCAGHRVVDVI